MEAKRKSASDTRSRADALILPTLGDIPCADLSKEQIDGWLNAVAKSPARIRSKRSAEGAVERQRFKEAPQDDEGRRKRRATANRTLTIFKAALNRGWRDKTIASDEAWRRVEPFEEADAARVRYLTIAEAQRFINACPDDFRLLVRAALATGASYGELAALKVGDFNPDSGTLHIRKSKSGKGRHVVLGDEGLALFSAQAAWLRPNAWLRGQGKPAPTRRSWWCVISEMRRDRSTGTDLSTMKQEEMKSRYNTKSRSRGPIRRLAVMAGLVPDIHAAPPSSTLKTNSTVVAIS